MPLVKGQRLQEIDHYHSTIAQAVIFVSGLALDFDHDIALDFEVNYIKLATVGMLIASCKLLYR